jgi:hypothetical protein
VPHSSLLSANRASVLWHWCGHTGGVLQIISYAGSVLLV